MQPIIIAEGVGKKYRIPKERERYSTLRDILSESLFHPLRSIQKKARELSGRDDAEDFWALRDVSFEIPQGEVVGIIGRNGAGKSTLLKILTRITPPTEGTIRMRGRVSSLLEVGTGFHPELSGRENVFLNGAILGMTRREITRKFSEIVEFAGIENFIDTPVKRYSSGMYVRLAFSVAAHLEPDVLLVDEVLAVGDAAFQKKCLGKMDEVAKSDGRTIIFVSHNMDAISRLCKSTMLIEKGRKAAFGETNDVIAQYLTSGAAEFTSHAFPIDGGDVALNSFSVTQHGKEVAGAIDGGAPCEVSLDITVHSKLSSFRSGILVTSNLGTIITRSFAQDWDPALENLEPGRYVISLSIPARLLLSGEYGVEAKLFSPGGKDYFERKTIRVPLSVQADHDYNEFRSKNPANRGLFLIPGTWKVDKK